jgi:transposase-like protein
MNAKGPETLTEAVKHYADLDVCHAYMAQLKWPDGVVKCPECGAENIGTIKSRRMFQCRNKECRKQFSVKVGTIFEDSPLGLDKWLVAVWCIANAKNGISSCELARAIGITQKSAWHMLHRIRHALKIESFDKMTGEVESDESFFGGKASNMHLKKRVEAQMSLDRYMGKAIVHGVLERGKKDKPSKVMAKVVANVKKRTLCEVIRSSVEPGTFLYTDTNRSYSDLVEYAHYVVDHTERYVQGRCHTNGLENFWSLFKRMVKGTYVSVDAQHLERYADEQVFRFNERKTNDAGRFALAMPGVVGRRLTYKELTGAMPPVGLCQAHAGSSGPAAQD